jgi:hypothetical protein
MRKYKISPNKEEDEVRKQKSYHKKHFSIFGENFVTLHLVWKARSRSRSTFD